MASRFITWYYLTVDGAVGCQGGHIGGLQLDRRETEFLHKPNVSILDQSSKDYYSGKDHRRLPTQHPLDDSGEALLRRADALLDEMLLGDLEPSGAGVFADERSAGDASVGDSLIEDKTKTFSPSPRSLPVNVADGSISSIGGSFTGDLSGSSGVESKARLAALQPEATPPAPLPAAASPDMGDPRGEEEEGAANRLSRKPTLIPAEQRYTTQRNRSAPPDDAGLSSNGATRASKPATLVRRQSTSLANTMTVGGRLGARSLLLPRELETDAEKAQQEIQALLAEISAALPATHEAARRSRHLLSKAQRILEENPSHTAEVDYYLQQVRRIVQRTRQMQNDSALYRRRLTIYLGGWVALAVTVLFARYWMQSELLDVLEMLFWGSEEVVWVQFIPMLIGAVFAGALGAALGALHTMQRHAAREYGYFDRKYGLRGLILPLLGGFFGALLAGLWAAVCIVTGLDESQLWIGAAPAAFAFAFGLIQEWLYGVR